MQQNDDFIMLPKIDFAFKELMTNDYVRKGFLSAVLNIKDTDIKSTSMKNTNMKKVHEDEKQSVLDVRLVMNDDTELDIEMQMAQMSTWAERSTFYLCKMLVEQTEVDKKYSNLKKCIAINILNFNFIAAAKKFHNVFHIREDTENDIIFTDKMEWHIIELPKLPENSDGTSLYDWARFINADRKEEFEMLAKKNDYLDAAFKHLEIISQDEAKRIEYTSRQKAVFDYNTIVDENFNRGVDFGVEKGRKEGITEGRVKERNLIISKLKAKGMSESEIEAILNN